MKQKASKPDKGNTWLHAQAESAFLACKELQGLPSFSNFDEYATAHPEGEGFRSWLTRDGHREVILVPGGGDTTKGNNLPGGYLWACALHYADGQIAVLVNDSDDGAVIKPVNSKEEAEKELQNLPQMAPFHLSDLTEFGYDFR